MAGNFPAAGGPGSFDQPDFFQRVRIPPFLTAFAVVEGGTRVYPTSPNAPNRGQRTGTLLLYPLMAGLSIDIALISRLYFKALQIAPEYGCVHGLLFLIALFKLCLERAHLPGCFRFGPPVDVLTHGPPGGRVVPTSTAPFQRPSAYFTAPETVCAARRPC